MRDEDASPRFVFENGVYVLEEGLLGICVQGGCLYITVLSSRKKG
jgi:hypothetical protein